MGRNSRVVVRRGSISTELYWMASNLSAHTALNHRLKWKHRSIENPYISKENITSIDGEESPMVETPTIQPILSEYDEIYLFNRFQAFERDRWSCIQCGSRDDLHTHHIETIPKGTFDPMVVHRVENLQTSCADCHKRLPKDWPIRFMRSVLPCERNVLGDRTIHQSDEAKGHETSNEERSHSNNCCCGGLLLPCPRRLLVQPTFSYRGTKYSSIRCSSLSLTRVRNHRHRRHVLTGLVWSHDGMPATRTWLNPRNVNGTWAHLSEAQEEDRGRRGESPVMRKYHSGFRREGACFLPDILGVAAHSYLSPTGGDREFKHDAP